MRQLPCLAVKDFAKFQHYRDRNPPWIKLYGTLLTDLKFLQMPEAAQAQLIKLWILASQFGHPLPNDPKLLAGKIGTTGRFHLAIMIDAGFLIPCEQIASTVLADDHQECQQNARPLDERGELERELQSVTAAVGLAEGQLAAKLATDADRIALAAIVARATTRSACIASLEAMLSGNDPAAAQPSLPHFGAALRDYAGNTNGWNAAHFRGYLRRASISPTGSTPALVRDTPAGRGAAMFARILELAEERVVPGQAPGRFIRRDSVAALGADVLRAYEAVGGAEKFLTTPKDKRSFLMRDFSQILDGVSHDAVA